MKKLLFASVNLDVGGIEKALVSLLNCLSEQKKDDNYKYDITLVLERKNGIFLDTLNKKIKIIEYTPSNNKIVFFRKIINFVKQINFIFRYKNKFDFSCAYATYSLPACFAARSSSKNSAIWCHMDYLAQYDGNIEKVKKFFNEKKIENFKHIIFVSEKSKKTFLQVFPNFESRTRHINNLINYKQIIELSKENIDEKELLNKKTNEVFFINVSRHDEEQKKISRIIMACKKLNEDNCNFKVILVGEGNDTSQYKRMTEEYKLQEKIIFLGRKKNPYPYIKLSDFVILSSDFEGSPVIYIEALTLNKAIITTDVAGSEQIENKYGEIIEKSEDSLYEKMKEFIEKGYILNYNFDAQKYNDEIIAELERIIE